MNRRELLQGIGAGAAVAAVGSAQEVRRAGAVKITELEVFRVHVNQRGNWVLFRLKTDAGLTGLGDASHGTRDDELVASIGREFLEIVKGRSIFDIEAFRKATNPVVAQRGRPASVALGGIEQAMWDLQGKALGVPIYQLFGGLLHRQIRGYANINRATNDDRSPAAFAANAERAVKAGFDAVKMAPWDEMPRINADPAEFEKGTQLGIDCTQAVRDVIGPDNDLLVDVHSHMDRRRGIELVRRLEPLNLFWVEETCRPWDDLAAVKKAAKMPTAGGESIFGTKKWFEYIAADTVDIVMPDIKYCGGLYELKKIAAMAEGAGMLTSPHGPASPIGHMSAAHVCATLPNFQILEFSYGETDWRAELVTPPEVIEKGRVTVSDRPGLGYELNEETIHKHQP